MLFFNYISVEPERGNEGEATKGDGARVASDYSDSEP